MTKTYINIDGVVKDTSSLTMPKDRTFRDAWQFNGDVVEVDIAKAKEMTKDRLRAERKPLFEALDAEFMKALETGADTSGIVARKQALRDITKSPALINAETVEQLKSIKLD